MTLEELKRRLTNLTERMDSSIDKVDIAATEAQQAIYEFIVEQIGLLDAASGQLVPQQNLAGRLAAITRYINTKLAEAYIPAVKDYLEEYFEIDQTNTALHKSYNQLVLEREFYTPLRKSIYRQAEYYLTDGLADAYVQPAKYLLMQAVSSGMTINDAKRMMRNWNSGKYSTGALLATNRPTPRLQTYATQMARDSMFSYNGAIQDNIKEQYGLTNFVYVGGVIKDSRTFCRNLVALRRKIAIDEIPGQIEKAAKEDGASIPNGMIPGTNTKNFLIRRGGYNCRHTCLVVR